MWAWKRRVEAFHQHTLESATNDCSDTHSVVLCEYNQALHVCRQFSHVVEHSVFVRTNLIYPPRNKGNGECWGNGEKVKREFFFLPEEDEVMMGDGTLSLDNGGDAEGCGRDGGDGGDGGAWRGIGRGICCEVGGALEKTEAFGSLRLDVYHHPTAPSTPPGAPPRKPLISGSSERDRNGFVGFARSRRSRMERTYSRF